MARDDADFAAAEARRIQAQNAINARVQKANDAKYNKANALNNGDGNKRLSRARSQVTTLERQVAAISGEVARQQAMSAKKGSAGSVAARALAQMQGGSNQSSMMGSVSNTALYGDIAARVRYGGYKPDASGLSKAQADLARIKAERDQLEKDLNPTYDKAGVAPSADPEMFGAGRRKAARTAQTRSGRQSTILSQG